tara:strand:+ start:883 stop:1965 length:1083 start_codon:yes stop_codon:yes gene_type:complete
MAQHTTAQWTKLHNPNQPIAAFTGVREAGAGMDIDEGFVQLVSHPGGITCIGCDIMRREPSSRIATLVASNSGRPGGACRAADGSVDEGTLHPHSTQEEDIIANWLITCGRTPAERNQLFSQISHEFGLNEPMGTTTTTIQRIDYTKVFQSIGPRMFADAWTVGGQMLAYKEGRRFDTNQVYPTALVFCAGPNANASSVAAGRAPTSSMRRTFCQKAHDDRAFFEAGAAWAVYAALYGAATSGCDVALVPFISGGLYAGPWRSEPDLLERFFVNVQRMARDGIMPDGTSVPILAGRALRKVIVVVLNDQHAGAPPPAFGPDAGPGVALGGGAQPAGDARANAARAAAARQGSGSRDFVIP